MATFYVGQRVRGVRRDWEGVVMWQPIETAPRDGTEIHVFGVQWYSDIDGHKKGPIQAIASFEGDPEAGEGYDWDVVASSYRRSSIKATHWRAVPEPPISEISGMNN